MMNSYFFYIKVAFGVLIPIYILSVIWSAPFHNQNWIISNVILIITLLLTVIRKPISLIVAFAGLFSSLYLIVHRIYLLDFIPVIILMIPLCGYVYLIYFQLIETKKSD